MWLMGNYLCTKCLYYLGLQSSLRPLRRSGPALGGVWKVMLTPFPLHAKASIYLRTAATGPEQNC